MNNKRLTGIQALRAIAFLEIFLGHCGMECFSASFGVAIFTILSGFCMGINYLPKSESLSLSPGNSVKFGISKVKRLYVLHLIMLLITYIMVQMPDSKEAITSLIADVLLLKSWRTNSADYFAYNGVSWYLSMYLFVCMGAPYVIRGIARIKKKTQLITAGAVVYAAMLVIGYYVSVTPIPIGDGFAKWLTYISPIYRSLDFSMGVMLGWIYLNYNKEWVRNSKAVIVLEVFAVLLFFLMEYAYIFVASKYPGLVDNAYFTFTALLFVWVFAVCGGPITKALDNKVLVLIGNLSSAAFLIHQIVIRWFKMQFRIEISENIYLVTVIIVCFVITFTSAQIYISMQQKLKR